ncbi:MAG: collagen-like protein [Clostridiales bacterium]|nr:collagen-like protein [Clostridiales bacterium]
MKKKWLISLATLTLGVATFGLVGCGEPGEKGDKGDNGKSAYEIWLEAGNEGTEEDFLAFLKGEKGDQGEKGNQGDKGDQGEKGDQGDKGDQGEDGLDGKSAYEIWLDNGNEGTEEDFLAWLKGLNDHTFGDWQVFTDGDVPCEQRMFYRICEDCSVIEWKNGDYDDHDWEIVTTEPTCISQGYDTKTCKICGKVEIENYTPVSSHHWETEYTTNKSFHWIDCKDCDATKDSGEHTTDDSGYCTVCDAPVGDTEGLLYAISADGTYAEVIGYEGTATKVIIADTYGDLPVKNIYVDAFYNNDNITSVVIPDSVTSIGGYAFYSCNSLTAVVIPDSVTSIGEWAFSNCESLTDVYYNGTIDDWVQIEFEDDSSGPFAENFYINNQLVTEAKITTATKINDYAFEGFDGLTSVVIGDSVTSIGEQAFSGCNSLTEIVIPDSVTSIGGWPFYGCNKLTYNTYRNCKYLGNEDNPYYALIEVVDNNYSSYQIHEDTKIIAGRAFDGCARMGSIIIPDGVTSIGNGAFMSCGCLTEIVIPDSVTSISNYVFWGCDLTIYCEAASRPSGWDSNWDYGCYSVNVVWGYKGE